MSENTTHRNLLITTIIIGLGIVLFSHLNSVEFRGEEPRRAIVAMEMDITGEYIVPKINGWNYYNKPPLFNWLLVLCFKIFGSYDTWVVRMPSMVCFLLCGLANYLFVKRYLSKETAILSSLAFLTAGDLLFYGTRVSGEIDFFFTLLVCLQVMFMYHFFRQEKFLYMFIVSYTLAAAGLLTKGTPAIVFQAITLLVLVGYYKKWRLLFHWKHFAGILCFVLITGAYFYAYATKEDVLPYMINLFKEASQKSGLENQSLKLITSIFSYPFLFIQWLLPWSFFTVYLFSRKTISEIRTNDFLGFLALFILVNIPFYWLTAFPKSRYVYMFFPFILTILVHAYSQRKLEWPKITNSIQLVFTIVIFSVPVTALLLPWIELKATIPNAWLKSLVIFFPSAGIAWLYWRYKSYRLYYFIFSLILIRLAVNFFYLPSLRYSKNGLLNLEHLNSIREIIKNEPLFLSGQPYTKVNNLDLGPIHIVASEINTAPLLSYIVPYYYTRETGLILTFEEQMRPNTWYLIAAVDIQSARVDTFYTYQEPWAKHEMALIRLK